jgi:hypothetical protein
MLRSLRSLRYSPAIGLSGREKEEAVERRSVSFVASPVAPAGRREAFVEEAPERLEGYPTLRKTAEIVKVDPASLSRRPEVKELAEWRGRECLFPPALVIDVAAYYRKRRLGAVASDLVDYALEHAPEYVDEIEAEVEDALRRHRRPIAAPSGAVFLAEAKRSLPADLYAQVESAYSAHLPLSGGSAYLGDEDDDE